MPDDLLDKLIAATQALIGRAVTAGDKIGIAVSGGADSMALLSLAHLCWAGRIGAATVDHGFRPEAADEAAMVASWCAARAIPHATLRPDAPISGTLQASARAARYHLLEAWAGDHGIDWLMTAHQADDQIETLMMRLNRGAGITGLAGVRARRGRLLRPLLDVSRADLRAWCVAQDVPFIDDPSNADPRFDRVRMRATLADNPVLGPAGVARSARALADAGEALDWMEEQLAASLLKSGDGLCSFDPAGLPREMARRLLLRCLTQMNENAEKPRGPSLDQAILQLFDGKTVPLADCLVTGGSSWLVRRAPPRRSD